MATPKQHIEEIRREKFSIGAMKQNPLTEDLHQAVKNLSAELYTTDVHFLMELIQNAEDNHYVKGVSPTLEFIITSNDITATGAPATLLIFNNEKGFARENIESICSVGRSTKKANKNLGYIGEKGIGFKSVFLITAQPYILTKAQQEGVYLLGLSSQDGRKILSSSFDKSEYDQVLNFLGVKQVSHDWYPNCIQSANLVDGVSEDLYVELLHFVAKNWPQFSYLPNIRQIPLIKYVAFDGIPSFFCINDFDFGVYNDKRVVLKDSGETCPCSWLISWNNVFASATNKYFMPESTQQAILQLPDKQSLLRWLAQDIYVGTLNLYLFAQVLSSSINNNCKLAVAYAHFLYHSLSKGYLTSQQVSSLCSSMPLVDNYGQINRFVDIHGNIVRSRYVVLLPANVSKWANLMVSNPWRKENYIELGKAYLNASSYAGQTTDSEMFIGFLRTYVRASDIPNLSPPDAGFSAADTPLTRDNAFLLLDWIRHINHSDLPVRAT